VRNELLDQYGDLQAALARHAYRDVVTKARNIIEGVLRWVLLEAGQTPGRDLFDHLGTLRRLIEERRAPVSDLTYHLAHKVRLLHARVHPEQVSSQGRSLAPELALSAVEDLREILIDARVVSP
jgi:hypothetical protein